jgi:hypothetical protein
MAVAKKSLHIQIDPELHGMIKIEAFKRGITMARFIDKAMRREVLDGRKFAAFPGDPATPPPPAVPLDSEETHETTT